MTEIKLNKRYKYAGDIMPKLLEIGFDLETAQDFLNSIKDADVAPKSEVAREIFKEIRELVKPIKKVIYHGEVIYESPISLNEIEKKYTEDK